MNHEESSLSLSFSGVRVVQPKSLYSSFELGGQGVTDMAKKLIKGQKSVSESTRRRRTFTGCWDCRSRKVKCDEVVPQCGPCIKRGMTCSGYQSKLVWVTSDQKYKPNERRFLSCESTWDQTQVLASEELDYFISLCDAAHHVKGSTVEWCSESRIPFSAFPIAKRGVSPSPKTLSRSLIYGSPLKDEETFLFQHYVTHVAALMMPFVDNRNPWRSSYPAAALYHLSQNRKALYLGLLAQAAFNLAHLGCGGERMLRLGIKNYTLAMETLRRSISEQKKDYGTFVASVLTLMFVEVYGGDSKSWRAHFNGAWKFLEDQQVEEPWNTSTFAEFSTQSLCLIKVISETSKVESSSEPFGYTQQRILSSISKAESFGFTIGAIGLLITCIADIKRLSHQLSADPTLSVDDATHSLLTRLDKCRQMSIKNDQDEGSSRYESSKTKMMAHYHLNAFIAATYIHLYQTLFDSPPSHTKPYITEVFHNLQAFFAIEDGNFSLWPAFIAAVASYDAEDIAAARMWLERISKLGIGSRVEVKKLIEEVWRVRAIKSNATGKDLESAKIDWREIMIEMDLDIILV